MENCWATIEKDGKKTKDTYWANTPNGIGKIFMQLLAKQFSGELKLREFYYVRSGDK